MSLLRFIARLDIKGPNVVKGIRMEGLRVVGKPDDLALKYQDADELLYIDTVASLYGRNQLENLLERTTERLFIPVTVGGGISSLGDVQRLLNAGADKIAVNTAAIRRPSLIDEVAKRYGNQCIVVSIEAKRVNGGWECYTDNGRERSGIEVQSWSREVVDRGAGELLITSVDQDGTMKGFDYDLVEVVARDCPVPVVACGGFGTVEHARKVLQCGADAIALASALHFDKTSFKELRDEFAKGKFPDQGSLAGRDQTNSEGGL